VTVHTILPERLTRAAGAVLDAAGVGHVAHGVREPMTAAEVAAADPAALAVIGPYRSGDVAEAIEATAPAGLPVLAPVATWAGVTRDDEPGCEDPARHRGTVFRMLARDTEVAARIAADVRDAGRRALVVAGAHAYGQQLDCQLRLAGLPRAVGSDEADLLLLAGLTQGPEVERAAACAPLPVVAFDGVQGAALGEREMHLALPYAPAEGAIGVADLLAGVERARAAAELLVRAHAEGAANRAEMTLALRELGGFDEHGDPPDPPVWLWRADRAWELEPDRPL